MLGTFRGRGTTVLLGLIALVGGCASTDRDAQEREFASLRGGLGSGSSEIVDQMLNAPAERRSSRARRTAEPELDALLAKEPTREVVLGAVVRRNPDAVAALERWVAYLARVPQKESPPNPTLRYGFSSMFKMHTAELMQELPFPTKLLTEGKAALAEARAMRADFHERTNTLREQADGAFAGLYLAQREVEIVEEGLKLVERFVEVAQAKLVAGKASQSDVLRAEVEREGLRADRAGLARQLEVAKSALNVLLDRDPEAELGAVKTLPEPTTTIEPAVLDRALDRRPELLAARERANAADAMVSRAQQEWVPDLIFGGAYVRDFGLDRNRAELTGGMSVPIWVPRILAGVREAEADRRRAAAEIRSTENRVLDEAKSAQARLLGTAERFAILSKAALPKARQNVKASEAAYASGAIDFLTLVDTQRMLLMKEIETERARAEWLVRRAELERATGGQEK